MNRVGRRFDEGTRVKTEKGGQKCQGPSRQAELKGGRTVTDEEQRNKQPNKQDSMQILKHHLHEPVKAVCSKE
jgi:hypothetical protein